MIRSTAIVLLLLTGTLVAQKRVVTVHPTKASLARRAQIPGTVLPEEQLELKARVSGYLAAIAVDDGSQVGKGDPLCRIDVPDLAAAVARAKAELLESEAAIGDADGALIVARADVKQAQAAVLVCSAEVKLLEVIAKRKRALVEKRGATQAELDEAEGRLAMGHARGESAKAAVEGAKAGAQAAEQAVASAKARRDSKKAELVQAEAMLQFASLTCPLERAVVTSRELDPGALIEKGQTVILHLARVDKLRIEIPVPERDATQVHKGTAVQLTFDAMPREPMQAKVSRTARSLSTSRVMWVQVDVDNADGKLLPGMFVHATLLLGQDDAVLTLPAQAVRHETDGKPWVFVVANGKAKRTPIETGKDNGILIEIKAGLDETSAVIVGAELDDGDPVTTGSGR